MNTIFRIIIPAILGVCMLMACSENVGEEEEFAKWEQRNTAYFNQKLNEAKTAIAQAQAQYGADWESHCAWRVIRSFAQQEEATGKSTDSICVRIIEHGNGSGCPIYTDSVRVNYIGRLIPSGSYPEGYVFDHSGPTLLPEDVFHPDFAQPTALLVSNTVEGFSTALQNMHIGDRWEVYIPYQLGYGSAATPTLPAYSTLIFDIQLKAYCKVGSEFKP